ncbi:unnamed protein product [Caenorhabditis angaria]|uniref:Uncharacterized protein n=1 Tax=Caenorhabditis angaria TaxID=860376 RepID=A0A9P1ITK0_9PELO|nr:unnamed protein product [Caenorhabditis angaria]
MKIPIVFLPLLILLSYSVVNCDEGNKIVLGNCAYAGNPDTEITHITWFFVRDRDGKVISFTRCQNNGGADPFKVCRKFKEIPGAPNTDGPKVPDGHHLTLLISVKQKQDRLVNDVEYRYIPKVMKMEKVRNPREMYGDNQRFNDNGLLNIQGVHIGGNYVNMCDEHRKALGISEHGLYVITQKNGGMNFQKAYFEPQASGEFFIY